MPKSYIHHYYYGVSIKKKLKCQSCNTQNRSYGEMANSLFDIYINTVIPHGKNMLQTASYTTMETMCSYPPSKYAIPHWKYFLRWCAQFTLIYLPSPQSDHQNSNVISTISFYFYQQILCCTLYVRHPLNDKK